MQTKFRAIPRFHIRIEPDWNVNRYERAKGMGYEDIRIEPDWNVNERGFLTDPQGLD